MNSSTILVPILNPLHVQSLIHFFQSVIGLGQMLTIGDHFIYYASIEKSNNLFALSRWACLRSLFMDLYNMCLIIVKWEYHSSLFFLLWYCQHFQVLWVDDFLGSFDLSFYVFVFGTTLVSSYFGFFFAYLRLPVMSYYFSFYCWLRRSLLSFYISSDCKNDSFFKYSTSSL